MNRWLAGIAFFASMLLMFSFQNCAEEGLPTGQKKELSSSGNQPKDNGGGQNQGSDQIPDLVFTSKPNSNITLNRQFNCQN